MTVFPCKRLNIRRLPAVALALVLVFLGTGRPTSAQNPAGKPAADPQKDKIHIAADVLTSDSEARFAEFIGNVRATQGDTVITSDHLKIFYSERMSTGGNPAVGEGAIERIIASGNVKIAFDNKVATAREAVYNTESMILILSGSPAKIISGTDSITGEKITYNRADGKIKVESGRNTRVEAVFHSEGGGIR